MVGSATTVMDNDDHMAGCITLAATPIGNSGDASDRLRVALTEADVVAAEDTRRVRRLVDALGVQTSARLVSYFEGNERARAVELVEQALGGSSILVLTDAGMPGISDPGFRLVRAAIEADVPVRVLPGPSAVLAALVVSGLPSDRFCFEGFLPRQAGPRRRRLTELSNEARTMVFFEAPHRAAATLAAMSEAFGSQRVAVACRELTKVHEEVVRGTLEQLHSWAQDGLLGEVTLVVGGASLPQVAAEVDLAAAVAAEESSGLDRRAAITTVARALGVPRKVVYQAVIEARG